MIENAFNMTGEVNVIIRAIKEASINGVNYIANEVISSFKGEVLMDSSQFQTDIATDKNLLSFFKANANAIGIKPRSLTPEIYKLISVKGTNDFYVPSIRTVSSNASGVVYTNATINNVIVKNSVGNIVTAIVDETTGVISTLEPTTEYKIYMGILKEGVSYQFDNSFLPFVQIELIAEGNINGITGHCYIKIDKASLSSSPRFNFNNQEVINVDLLFKIINEEALMVYY
jgi:hypothetical protein